MDLLPHYDELWIVSDLHMGGERTGVRNFQIFRRGERLANFIRYVTDQRPGDDVALLLNGDIIDSLAEDTVPGYVALDIDIALQMMDRLYRDPAFADVWEALGQFVRTPKRHLVLVIGNHDIELALTPVQASLRQRLAAGDAAAQARLVFATNGGGFACRVGARRVFCTHGNEVDKWNIVDYDGLGSLDSAMNAGRRVDATRWVPNAGTRMVIDIMNKVKERHPFVDLLKPENQAVLSALLTLDPELVKLVDLGSSYRIVRNLISGNEEVRALLSAGQDLENVSQATVASAAVAELLGPHLSEGVRTFQTVVSEDDLLLAAERDFAKAIITVDASIPAGATLGWTDMIAGFLGRLTPEEALRRALLDWLGSDTTFDVEKRDDTFNAIVDRVGPDVDFIVTGHTHLARAIEFSAGRHYFNCGTWIRLLRLTPQALADEKVFHEVYVALAKKTMEALDNAPKIPGPNGEVDLLLDRTDAVRISRNGTEVAGELLRVVDGVTPASVTFEKETGGLGK